jgi:cytochrome c oxidase subunit 3
MKQNLNLLIKQNRWRHPFHIVTPSPWPFFLSISVFSLVLNFVMYLHFYPNAGIFCLLSFFFFLLTLFGWFNDIIFESTFQLKHTFLVRRGLRLGVVFFIISEVMFFFSFFWAFFHASLAPAIQIGCVWPPKGIMVFNPWEVPFLNTLILLLSGGWATLAHHIFKTQQKKYYKLALKSFIFAIFLGICFTGFQIYEYITASFSISDSVYGSIFFLATGFHGFHVLIGTIFLIVVALRHYFKHFFHMEAVAVDAAVWYWHFVDVVWLFLFVSIYWWGS